MNPTIQKTSHTHQRLDQWRNVFKIVIDVQQSFDTKITMDMMTDSLVAISFSFYLGIMESWSILVGVLSSVPARDGQRTFERFVARFADDRLAYSQRIIDETNSDERRRLVARRFSLDIVKNTILRDLYSEGIISELMCNANLVDQPFRDAFGWDCDEKFLS